MTQAKLKIKKGDQVVVLTGKDKGSKGEVQQVIPAKNRVIVQGVNVVKKHQKPTQFAQGGIVNKELSIHVSNVALIDPKSGEPTRIGYKTLKDGSKVRVARKSGEEVDGTATGKAVKSADDKKAAAKDAVTKAATKKAPAKKAEAKKEDKPAAKKATAKKTTTKKAPAKKAAAKKED